MGEAGDESLPNRISGARHHDRDRVRGVLGDADRGSAHAHQHVHRELDQLGRSVAEPLGTALRSPQLNNEILPLDIAEVAQTLPKSIQNLWGRAPTMEQTNPVHLCRLLRRGGERRHEDAKRKQDGERHRLHWITSSASTKRCGGMVSPRALAVLRLMTNSNFMGCSTGRLAGLVPLRILST